MFNIMDIMSECTAPDLGIILASLRNILKLIQVIGPILLIVASIYNFIQLVKNPEEKKLSAKIRNSFVAAIILFLVPTIVNISMGLLDNSYTVSSCWNAVNYSGINTTYISINNEEKKQIVSDSSKYEKGKPRKSQGGTGPAIEGTARQIGDVVWDSGNVTRISNLTSTQLIGILNSYGGNATNFVPYASNYITAENRYNVNVFFLLALNALESGWGTSAIARGCNNLGGVCESSNHPSNGCGSNYNCAFARFNSMGEFIDYNAAMLNENYLTPGGDYYEGVSLSQVYTIHYCPGCTDAAGTINTIATELFNETSKVF